MKKKFTVFFLNTKIMLTLRTGQDRTRKIANLTWLSRKLVTGSFCNYCDVSMLVQCALQDKYLVAPPSECIFPPGNHHAAGGVDALLGGWSPIEGQGRGT